MLKSSLFNKVRLLRNRKTDYTWDGHKLSREDNQKISDALLLTAFLTYDQIDFSCITEEDAVSQLIQWLYVSSTADVLDWHNANKLTVDCLRRQNMVDWHELQGRFKGAYPNTKPNASQLLLPARLIVQSYNKEDIALRRILTSVMLHWSKINLTLPLRKKLEQDYISFEREMSSWQFPDEIVTDLNGILKEWLKDYSYLPLAKNGPGGVAHVGRSSIPMKYRMIVPTSAHRSFFPDEPLVWPPYQTPIWESVAEVIFVAKSVKTYRTICMEPATQQYFQQGVEDSLAQLFRDKSFLRQHIDLNDQSKSREAAKKGSKSGKYSTIDLSNASDSVHYKLIDAVFCSTPVYPHLVATRTTSAALPSGRVIRLNKFAPMGSALCFPVECLVFAAVCEYCYRKSGFKNNSGKWTVYGDDIIVDTSVSSLVLETLNALHFSVNLEKTFCDPDILFRESCGGEYFSGYDVTPIVLSRKFTSLDNLGSGSYSDGVDLANRYFDSGSSLCRRVVISFLKPRNPERLIPFSEDGHIGLKSNNVSNYHLKRTVRHGNILSVVYTGVTTRYVLEKEKPKAKKTCQGYQKVSNAEKVTVWLNEVRNHEELRDPLSFPLGKPYHRLNRATIPLYQLRS